MMNIPIQDVILILDHPHGRIEVPLDQWIATGPGPRKFLRPIAAKSRETGEEVPLDLVPLQYRNNTFTRALIALGLMKNPWAGRDDSGS